MLLLAPLVAAADGTGQPAAAASTAPQTPLPPPPVTVPLVERPLVDGAPVAADPGPPLLLPEPQVLYRRRYNLSILGGGLLLSTWGADRLLARDLPDTGLSWLPWIPLAGPWYLLYSQSQLSSPSPLTSAMLVFDGLLQAGGLTVGILGFVLHKKRLVVTLPPAPAS